MGTGYKGVQGMLTYQPQSTFSRSLREVKQVIEDSKLDLLIRIVYAQDGGGRGGGGV